jgi:hypothetical protein
MATWIFFCLQPQQCFALCLGKSQKVSTRAASVENTIENQPQFSLYFLFSHSPLHISGSFKNPKCRMHEKLCGILLILHTLVLLHNKTENCFSPYPRSEGDINLYRRLQIAMQCLVNCEESMQ